MAPCCKTFLLNHSPRTGRNINNLEGNQWLEEVATENIVAKTAAFLLQICKNRGRVPRTATQRFNHTSSWPAAKKVENVHCGQLPGVEVCIENPESSLIFRYPPLLNELWAVRAHRRDVACHFRPPIGHEPTGPPTLKRFEIFCTSLHILDGIPGPEIRPAWPDRVAFTHPCLLYDAISPVIAEAVLRNCFSESVRRPRPGLRDWEAEDCVTMSSDVGSASLQAKPKAGAKAEAMAKAKAGAGTNAQAKTAKLARKAKAKSTAAKSAKSATKSAAAKSAANAKVKSAAAKSAAKSAAKAKAKSAATKAAAKAKAGAKAQGQAKTKGV